MQPSLFEQIDAEKTAAQQKLVKQKQRKANRRYANHYKFSNHEPYNPRLLKKRLLEVIGCDEWTGFIGLSGKVKMSPEAVDHMLNKLVRWGYLEETPLYFLRRNDSLLKPDRTIKPIGYYNGFEFGYRRLTTK